MEEAPTVHPPCHGRTELFFSDAAQDQAVAKAICAGCLLKVACRRQALVTKAPAGIWGGLVAPDEVRRWAKAEGLAVQRQHPSTGGAA
jgi:hypothetical protein